MILTREQIAGLLEYPRPDFRRDFISLDGQWKIMFYRSSKKARAALDSYIKTGAMDTRGWDSIEVPFCIESAASGIKKRFSRVHAVYFLEFDLEIPPDMDLVHLNFGAVDHSCCIYVNGQLRAEHSGGYTPIRVTMESRELLQKGNTIAVHVEDSLSPSFLRGKQSVFRKNRFVFYTPVSGIWQSVWLEYTSACFLDRFNFYPGSGSCSIELYFSEPPHDFSCEFYFSNVPVSISRENFSVSFREGMYCYSAYISTGGLKHVPEAWSPESPHLHPVVIRAYIKKGRRKVPADMVESQVGLRIIERRGSRLFLNGKPLYQRLVLNQGYYPEGWYRPSEKMDYTRDLDLISGAGFNGMRIHEKIEDPALLFCADAMGLLVWEEFPSPMLYNRKSRKELLDAMAEISCRDFNHPSIITWVIFNESWGLYNRLFSSSFRNILHEFYSIMKTLDPGRPVIDNSGFYHAVTDIIDIHHYVPDTARIRDYYHDLSERGFRTFSLKLFLGLFRNIETSQPEIHNRDFTDTGQPVIISEFGGYGFYETEDRDFQDLYKEWISLILENETLQGFCYTQFTDVEQEQNGIFTFDRVPRAPLKTIRRITQGKASH